MFVESEKAALAMTAWAARMIRGEKKLLPVGTGGCWGWSGRIGKRTNALGERIDERGPLPDLQFFAGRKTYILFDTNAADNIEVRKARKKFAAALRALKCKITILDLPGGTGVNGPDDFLAVQGDQALARVFISDAPSPTRVLTSEQANAERLAEKHGADLRFCSDCGVWYVWNGKFCSVNDLGDVMRRMQDIGTDIYLEAVATPDRKLRDALADWALKSESRRTQENSVALARYMEGIETRRFADLCAIAKGMNSCQCFGRVHRPAASSLL